MRKILLTIIVFLILFLGIATLWIQLPKTYGSEKYPCYIYAGRNAPDDRFYYQGENRFRVECVGELLGTVASDTKLDLSQYVDLPVIVKGKKVKKEGRSGDVVCVRAPCFAPRSIETFRVDSVSLLK